MPTRCDTALLAALAEDLEAGFAAFVRAHSGPVYSTALRLSGSRADADDLAQETFVRAYGALRRFDAERVLALESRPWLLTITLNLWRNRLRGAARRPREARAVPGVPVVDRRPGPEERAEESEASRALVALLAELPEHQRVPVVLRHVVGLSYAEIASTVGCPVGTAKANVSRGLERLRALAGAGAPRPRTPHRPRSPARSRTPAHLKEAP